MARSHPHPHYLPLTNTGKDGDKAIGLICTVTRRSVVVRWCEGRVDRGISHRATRVEVERTGGSLPILEGVQAINLVRKKN